MRRILILGLVTFAILAMTCSCGEDSSVTGPPPPDLGMRYDQVTWLTSHNAFAYFDWTEEIPDNGLCVNQLTSIHDQLEHGVRALQLDIHLWDDNDPNAEPVVYLCHGASEVPLPMCAQLRFTPLADELAVMAAFLAANPNAIVTILFEDYVQDEAMVVAPFRQTPVPGGSLSLVDLVYNPSGADWNVSDHGVWPTIQWLVDNQQRLVVLADGDYDFFASGREYMRGNSWDSIEPGDSDCHLKADPSAYEGRLFLMYHLSGPKLMNGWDCPSLSTPFAPSEINTAGFILQRYEDSCGPAFGRPPVFLSVDFVDGCPVGQDLCDSAATYYSGPLEVVQYFNREVWPAIRSQ